MRKLVGVAATVGVAVLGAVACDDYPVVTRPAQEGGSALEIQVLAGDGQKGITQEPLLDPITVEVTGGDGAARSGVAVKWEIVSGDGGSLRSSSVRTNEQGIARNTWRVGRRPGATDSVKVWFEGAVGAKDTVFFTAAVTGVPDTIVVIQGAIETDNNFKEPERVVGDTVFVAPNHWARKPFKAVVRDNAGRTVRGASLTWTVTSRGGSVGDEPETGAETVKVITGTRGGITVWRRAPTQGALNSTAGDECVADVDGDGDNELTTHCWIGATLSLEQYPDVTPITLDALVRKD